MEGRTYLVNVGANTSHGFASPIFPDGTFEFLPIPEDRDLSGPHAVRYGALVSHNAPGSSLRAFVPRRLWGWPAHNDPEFETFTYGDRCETSPRAASLRRVVPGDTILFIARLVEWENGARTGRHGFYLIGFLQVEEVLRDVASRPPEHVLRGFQANAHVRRGLSDPALWDGFWVFKGSRRSRRFHHAAPVTREMAGRVFVQADGKPWRWDGGRTDLQVIGSYTRSCRCVIDSARPEDAGRRDALWEWVSRYDRSGAVPSGL